MTRLKKGDARRIFREWVVDERFEISPETGLPALPDGLHWHLEDDGMYSYCLSVRYSRWGHCIRVRLDTASRPSRGSLPGHAMDALREAADVYREREKVRRNAAPLGAYPPNSVTG